MCELPARSMPGSEMLFVEKTRIRGTNVFVGILRLHRGERGHRG